jgi:hypothetical protein
VFFVSREEQAVAQRDEKGQRRRRRRPSSNPSSLQPVANHLESGPMIGVGEVAVAVIKRSTCACPRLVLERPHGGRHRSLHQLGRGRSESARQARIRRAPAYSGRVRPISPSASGAAEPRAAGRRVTRSASSRTRSGSQACRRPSSLPSRLRAARSGEAGRAEVAVEQGMAGEVDDAYAAGRAGSLRRWRLRRDLAALPRQARLRTSSRRRAAQEAQAVATERGVLGSPGRAAG